MQEAWVLIVGNVIDGLMIVGPFEEMEDAQHYGKSHRNIREAIGGWVIDTLEEPEEEEE